MVSKRPKSSHFAHGERKTCQLRVLVTPTAKKLLEEKAALAGVSLSELLEQLARNQELGKHSETDKRLCV